MHDSNLNGPKISKPQCLDYIVSTDFHWLLTLAFTGGDWRVSPLPVAAPLQRLLRRDPQDSYGLQLAFTLPHIHQPKEMS